MNQQLTIQFIRNYTAEPIGLALQEAGRKSGFDIKTEFGAYDNLGAELAAVATRARTPSFVILTIDLEYFAGGIFSPNWRLEQAMEEMGALLNAIDMFPAKVFFLISTFIAPFEISLPWIPNHPVLGRQGAAFELNRILRAFVAERSDRCGLLDFERIALQLGEGSTRDKRFGLMMKAPFKQEFVQAAAREAMRYLRYLFLPPKKALVLDCDNTLWGGVIGEAGLEKIELDPYDYPGIAYYRFQSEILSIAEKGFLICLCSKNDASAVWEVLDKHPHCLIRRQNIASSRINWSDKASNLKEIALELNLSLDSMVYVDDNPAECELIQSQFPEVFVIQTPARIYELPGALNASGLFDKLTISKEDKQRAQYYQSESERRELQKRHVDAEGFLRDLKMKAVVRPMERADIGRASQLCQRTNQFNLTSRRYGESDLATFLEDPNIQMFLLEAEDRFGSLGQSGLIIFRRMEEDVEVDTFLMSCRIIGRLLDRALFSESIRKMAARWQFRALHAAFIPTQKNGIVSGLWKDYGFSKAANDGNIYSCLLPDLNVPFPAIIELAEHI